MALVSRHQQSSPPRLRAQRLRQQTIEPLFRDLPSPPPAPRPLPRIIERNRWERAQQRLAEALASRGGVPISPELLAELRGLVVRWAELRFEDGFTEVAEFEIRCAEEAEQIIEADAGPVVVERAEAEGTLAYLQGVLDRLAVMEPLPPEPGRPGGAPLGHLYVPLHVHDLEGLEGQGARSVPRFGARRVEALAALSRHERVLLLGGAGSGKTTLLRYLAARSAATGLRDPSAQGPIPFLVAARQLDRGRLDEQAISQLSGCGGAILMPLLADRRGLVLVDGLDEVEPECAPRLLASLEELARRHPGSRIVVTGRPAGIPEPSPGFHTTRLLPLQPLEAEDLIERFHAVPGPADTPAGPAPEAAAARDLKMRVWIERAAGRMVETPLLCRLVCAVHRRLGRLPEGTSALYETCLDVLLGGPVPGGVLEPLGPRHRLSLLSELASFMHRARAAELPAPWVVRQLAAGLQARGRSPAAAAPILREVREHGGLWIERRAGHLSFIHPTFQEYLTAWGWVQTGRYDLRPATIADPWWQEVIVHAAGMPGAATATIVTALLGQDPEGDGHGTQLAARCLESAPLPEPLREEVERRLARLGLPRG